MNEPERETPSPPLSPPPPGKLEGEWLQHFYKECGREATLAYTTLNQVKNWAILIVAAFISAAVGIGKPWAAETLAPEAKVGIYAAAVGTYVFNLRFFFRAILCYINLLRWNRLQASIVAVKLLPPLPRAGSAAASEIDLLARLRQDIELYYHEWRSPIGRLDQVLQNLKLGFALVLVFPLLFVVVWAVQFWSHAVVRGLFAFVVGSTLVEFTDFYRSSFFDTPERFAVRRSRSNQSSFPRPVSGVGYLVSWAFTLVVTALVALWPEIAKLLPQVKCG
jgi:hypothetical protein